MFDSVSSARSFFKFIYFRGAFDVVLTPNSIQCFTVLHCHYYFFIFFSYTQLKLASLFAGIRRPVQQIAYLLPGFKCNTKPYATNYCKLPWMQIIIAEKKKYSVRVSSIINSPGFFFFFCALQIGKDSPWAVCLVCCPGCRRCNRASIITLPEAE